jgi:SAM-dependent methyltransferase
VYRARVTPRDKQYDQAYFDRWYRDPRHMVVQGGVLERRVQLAVAATEYLLERPLRSVLDVGCGEAPWRALLLRARPRVRYQGVDPSEYAVRRFGRSRNIRLGRVSDLERLGLDGPFDLIVCSDVLHYVPTPALRRGLRAISELCGGVAFLEMYPAEDDTEGDDVGYQKRSAPTYRRLIRAARLIPLGLHCYASWRLKDELTALEKGG